MMLYTQYMHKLVACCYFVVVVAHTLEEKNEWVIFYYEFMGQITFIPSQNNVQINCSFLKM